MLHPSDIMNAQSSRDLSKLIAQSKEDRSPKSKKQFTDFSDFLKKRGN